jgi:hypothetical protein
VLPTALPTRAPGPDTRALHCSTCHILCAPPLTPPQDVVHPQPSPRFPHLPAPPILTPQSSILNPATYRRTFAHFFSGRVCSKGSEILLKISTKTFTGYHHLKPVQNPRKTTRKPAESRVSHPVQTLWITCETPVLKPAEKRWKDLTFRY